MLASVTPLTLRSLARAGLLFSALLSVTACSTITDWFVDEEELAVRRIPPIENKFPPTILWQTSVGDGVGSHFSTLRPVFADSKVIVADRVGEIVALDPASGESIWRQDFADIKQQGMLGGLFSANEPAKIGGLSVGGNKVFVGTENGVVMALSLESGDILWQTSVKGEVLAAPGYAEGIVVVNTGGGTLFAMNATNGEALWKSESDVPPLTLRGIPAPVVASGGVLLGTAMGKVQANILESGIVAWETAITAPSGSTDLERLVDVDATPLLYAGTLYTLSYNGTLAAVELRTGRVVWKREYAGYRRITLAANRLFVVDNTSHVYALDRRNGVELWSQGGLKMRALTGAEPVGDYLVLGDKWGLLHWLDQEDGRLVARYDLGGDDDDEGIYSEPLNIGSALITVTRSGDVAAFAIPD